MTRGMGVMIATGWVLIGFVSLSSYAQPRPVSVEPLHPRELHVLSSTGARAVAAASRQVTVRPNQLLIALLADPVKEEKRQEGGIRWTLPYRIIGVDSSGTKMELRLVVDVDKGGMTFVPSSARFEGRLFVGVVDAKNPASAKPLAQKAQVQVTGTVDTIEPATVSVNHSNLPFAPVHLAAANPADSVQLSFRFTFSPSTLEKDLPVIRPKLNLKVSPNRVGGLGLETATIVVRLEGLTTPEGREVTLDTDRGGLEATTIRLNNSGAGSTSIRSIGIGMARITAADPPATTGQVTVRFMWPWGFLLGATAGGVCGAGIRALTLRKKQQLSTKAVTAMIGSGVLIGILVAAAYAVGVNLTGIRPLAKAGEALVFVLSALGSYLGKIAVPK